MTVAEYRGEFTRVERFALCICTIEAERAKRFQNGLDLDILSHINSVTYPRLSAIVSVTTLQETILRRQGKRRAKPTPDWRSQRRHHSHPQGQRGQMSGTGGRQQQQSQPPTQTRYTGLPRGNRV